jgi:hypothetical protein
MNFLPAMPFLPDQTGTARLADFAVLVCTGSLAGGVFRIDHDQAFQSTLNLRYQRLAMLSGPHSLIA